MPSQQLNTDCNILEYLKYLEDYIDTLETLPADMQRSFTLLKQLDANAQDELDKVAELSRRLAQNISELSPENRIDQLRKISDDLCMTWKFAEERVSIAMSAYESVDMHIRRLDDDLKKLEDTLMTGPSKTHETTDDVIQEEKNSRKRAVKNDEKAKKRAVNGDLKQIQTVEDMPIDPNEPLYCYCNNVSYGEMVACDNE
ncbi:3685_t:CDS:2, partial [Acaulospora morrowiae]